MTDPFDTAAGSVRQAEACASYIDCASAVDGDNADLYGAVYGDEGECWSGTSRDALACAQACSEGLARLGALAPTEETCWADGEPSALNVFSNSPEWRYANLEGGGCYDVTVAYTPARTGSAFTLTMVFTSAYVLAGFDCELDDKLSFECDGVETESDGSATTDGTFAADLFSSDFHFADNDTDCTYTGGPA